MSWWTPLFGVCCQGEKPGGFTLTDRAVDYCGFTPDSRLLDVAGGSGETVRHLRTRLGCWVTGIDSDPERQGPDVSLAQAERLPWEEETFDGVLMECALSQMELPETPLAECARVLRPGGYLILSDLYDRMGVGAEQTPLGRLVSREALERHLQNAGLNPILFEDHSRLLAAQWAGAVMSGSGSELSRVLRQTPQLRGVKCGYYLCVAKKLENPL